MVLSLATRKCAPDIVVIELSGRITLGGERGQIETAVLKALSEGIRKIVVDLSRVTYLDSTGIGIIAYCFGKTAQSGGRLSVSGAKGVVRELFRVAHLDGLIGFFPDAAAACENFAAAAPG